MGCLFINPLNVSAVFEGEEESIEILWHEIMSLLGIYLSCCMVHRQGNKSNAD
jgi:hypothetical protein